MASYMMGQFLTTLISVHFPGGRLGFAKAGCDVTAVPVPGEKDVAYILVPKAVENELDLTAFRDAVEKACTRKHIRLRWVSDSNFGDRAPQELRNEIMATVTTLGMLGFNVGIAFTPAVCVITTYGEKENTEKVLMVIEACNIVKRVIVVQTVGCVERTIELTTPDTPAVTPEATTKIEGFSRDAVITKDEVTNLTIMLEKGDVDVLDFIKSI